LIVDLQVEADDVPDAHLGNDANVEDVEKHSNVEGDGNDADKVC
jgi:hypothetical protein